MNKNVYRKFLDVLPDKIAIKLQFFKHFHYFPDIKNPKTFNEKLQWLKLYDHNPLYTVLVDKYAVREYIKNKIGDEYLIPLVGGPWENFDEIEFEKLPDKFVLKCTHDSGSTVICTDKNSFDIEMAKNKLTSKLKRNAYYYGREWPYKNVKPKIIAEKYMVDESGYELKDYKFFCFNSEVKALYIATSRYIDTRFDFYDVDFNHLPFTNAHPCSEKIINKPKNYEEMVKLAGKLSLNVPHVRIDFYNINGRIYFGEITFYHMSGMMPFVPKEWDYTFGQWIDLNKAYNVNEYKKVIKK